MPRLTSVGWTVPPPCASSMAFFITPAAVAETSLLCTAIWLAVSDCGSAIIAFCSVFTRASCASLASAVATKPTVTKAGRLTQLANPHIAEPRVAAVMGEDDGVSPCLIVFELVKMGGLRNVGPGLGRHCGAQFGRRMKLLSPAMPNGRPLPMKEARAILNSVADVVRVVLRGEGWTWGDRLA